ncbi:MAG TPA: ABC transporter ATP-binding protein [Chitinophagaceae bacterium]|nr:ABC transporter ATP-binding protein [Chitinophagaceae bacterium]HMZ46814.1 ABC transporter ATP-binding protein [Chitinophagaceae bacterium]HNE93511.1 ABC transporter ATP-binding protein [Chitinophagaceae bacterium]HNF30065.1 ABC transporter ATP-binding protein [Chitinophagaceae bacterium]HNJ58533.1 ABC transporter ATP-binding protein [Chitinophagaceae bacterium]
MSFLKVENLSKVINNKAIVNQVSFKQFKRENIAIAGATGSGKTTLLKLIAGLLQPTNGNVFLEENRVKGSEEKLLPGHKSIAYLNQHFELRNNYFVHELLDVFNAITEEEAYRIYTICAITNLLQRKTNELSGGEKQRIALAAQLVTNPSLLLLDEPFSNLDLWQKNNIKNVLTDLQKELQLSIILTSHDWTDILPWANTILVMKNGEVIQQGNPFTIYHNPINEYVAGLSGAYNIIDVSNVQHFSNSILKQDALKKIFLRPEQIEIEPANNIFQKDVIQEVYFYGSYNIVDVLVNNEIVKVKTTNNTLTVGQRVFLTVKPIEFWYL